MSNATLPKYDATYISPANTAKLVRAALKAAFPATKFSVRTDTYSMGATVRVRWTDGPTTNLVDDVVAMFDGKGFDGMIDMAYSIQAWVLNGEVIGTRCAGTAGNRGTVEAWGMIPPHDDAELVHFACGVSTSRELTPALANRCIAQVATFYGIADAPVAIANGSGWQIAGGRGSQHPVNGDDWYSLIHQAAGDRTRFLPAE